MLMLGCKVYPYFPLKGVVLEEELPKCTLRRTNRPGCTVHSCSGLSKWSASPLFILFAPWSPVVFRFLASSPRFPRKCFSPLWLSGRPQPSLDRDSPHWKLLTLASEGVSLPVSLQQRSDCPVCSWLVCDSQHFVVKDVESYFHPRKHRHIVVEELLIQSPLGCFWMNTAVITRLVKMHQWGSQWAELRTFIVQQFFLLDVTTAIFAASWFDWRL